MGIQIPIILMAYLCPEKVLLLRQAENRVVVDGKGADAQQQAGVFQGHRQRNEH